MRRTVLAAVVLALAMWQAQAEVPREIHFQGRLTDTGGAPITATLNVTFALYDAATGGSPLWSEIHSLDISDGLFSARLGQVSPLDPPLFRDNPRLYLGVTVDTDAEMAPRYPLCSAAYAILAMEAQSAPTPSSLDASDGDPVDAVVVDDLGRVGIGQPAPAAPLDVAGTVQASGDFKYAAAKPFAKAVGNLEFSRTGVSGDLWVNHANYGYINGGSSPFATSVGAPVYLPDGAVVTEVTVYYVNFNGTYLVSGTLALSRTSLASSGSANMATVNLTDDNSGTYQSDNTTIINNATIDNQAYKYYMTLNWDQDLCVGSEMRFFGAKIDYTLETLAP